MAVIYYFSSQPAEISNGLSEGITRDIIKFISWIFHLNIGTNITQELLDRLNDILREYAHAMAYLVLAFFVFALLRRYKPRSFRAFIYTFAFCAFYAVTDEIHQLFVPGRSFELIDLAFDCIGSMAGIGAYYLVHKISRYIKRLIIR